MAKFASKWKTADPVTDIARLEYPHTVQDTSETVLAKIATAEEAEALLDWYKDNYEHGNITPKLVRHAPARAKLRYATSRKLFLEAQTVSRARIAEERATAKDARDVELGTRYAVRQNVKARAQATTVVPERLAMLKAAVDDVVTEIAAMSDYGDVPTREYVAQAGRLAQNLKLKVETMRHLQYILASSRAFAIHCQDEEAAEA